MLRLVIDALRQMHVAAASAIENKPVRALANDWSAQLTDAQLSLSGALRRTQKMCTKLNTLANAFDAQQSIFNGSHGTHARDTD
jgi:hypothetical protein